jgi:hypothetical protein
VRKLRDPAWKPVDYTHADVMALKALARGEATPDQQRSAVAWMIGSAGTYDLSFRSDVDGGDRETAFAEGKRFMGLQLVKLINMPEKLVAKLRETE